MQKVIGVLTAIALTISLTSFYQPNKEKIQWMSLEEMQEAFRTQPRPILVDVYTDWCGWCKVMDRQTYDNPQVAAYINEKYYAVKFDAESKKKVSLNGKLYSFNERNRVHDMAVYLLGGQLSYPSTVFLSAPDAQPAPLPGFMKPKEFESPLRFFGEGVYKTKNFPEYVKNFKGSW